MVVRIQTSIPKVGARGSGLEPELDSSKGCRATDYTTPEGLPTLRGSVASRRCDVLSLVIDQLDTLSRATTATTGPRWRPSAATGWAWQVMPLSRPSLS